MARVLLINEDEDAQRTLDQHLRLAGHEVTTALRGQDGMRAAREHPPDLVILDRKLPDEDGTEVCRMLKWEPHTRDVPVVMLSSTNDEIDRIVSLELGAEDYVAKPYNIRELMLRVRAILRRRRGSVDRPVAIDEAGRLRVDRDAHRLWVDGRQAQLTPLEFRLLLHLYDHRAQVLSRGVLLRELWGMDDGDASSRALDTTVKRLRKKLGAAGMYIQTVRGTGYRFSTVPGLHGDQAQNEDHE